MKLKAKLICVIIISCAFILGGCAPAPEPLDLATDLIYLNMTMEEADELFGEPLSVLGNDDGSGYGEGKYLRTYENAGCVFGTDENGNTYLFSFMIYSKGYAPVRGIEVGDSLETVLSRIALAPENGVDNIEYGVRTYRYEIIRDIMQWSNIPSTYDATIVSYYNSGESFETNGILMFFIDEKIDEVTGIMVNLW
jgi:hypothetical protein